MRRSSLPLAFLLVTACGPGGGPATGGPTPTPAGPPTATWTEPAGWGSTMGAGPWTYRTLGTLRGADLSLSVDARVDQGSSSDLPVHQLDRFAGYNNQEDI